MTKNYSGKIFIQFLLLIFLFSCQEKKEAGSIADAAHQHSEESKFTCPMHPQIVRDEPGKCPICGMDLVPVSRSNELHLDSSLLPLLKPVNEQVVSTISTVTPDSGSRIFTLPVQGIVAYDTRNEESISSRVAGRIERMYIKYNYQPISKGQLIMEIYSPDLAAAQRELIYISRSGDDASLLQKAKQRLSLLGMQTSQINQVIKTGNPLYRVPVYSTVSGYIVERNVAANAASPRTAMPSSAGSSDGMAGDASVSSTAASPQTFNPTPVMLREGQYVGAGENVFTLYKGNSLVAEFSFPASLAAEVKVGQKLVYQTVANAIDIKTGSIALIEPIQRNGETFTVARVYISGNDLLPGQLLKANIPVVKNSAYWLPQNAILQMGSKAVVFKKENGVFIPRQVHTGIIVNGMVEIKNAIGGWQVAKNASFLVDSESFIRLNSNDAK